MAGRSAAAARPVSDNRLRLGLSQALLGLGGDWQPLVSSWSASPAGQALRTHLAARLAAGADVVPHQPFRALQLTPLHNVRVLILGQDPYHGPGQAEGLAFSVPNGQPVPPSLRNIRQEVGRDLGQAPQTEGSLADWALQGVLLLNTALTVELGQPGAHAGRGWEVLTDAIVAAVAGLPQPVVFMLWGRHAQAKAAVIEQGGAARHLVLACNHPSPLSARRGPEPFVGCGHFSRANAFFGQQHPALPPIRWLG